MSLAFRIPLKLNFLWENRTASIIVELMRSDEIDLIIGRRSDHKSKQTINKYIYSQTINSIAH